MKKSKEISEFDKIYIAKYCENVDIGELAYTIYSTSNVIREVISELKRSGLYDIYKNLSDEEWEKLEKKSNEYIKEKYLLQHKEKNKAMFKQILDAFAVDINEVISQFEIFDELKWELKGIKDRKIVDEEWKKIENFNYSISNYGRVRNDLTNKIKNPRFHRFILQVDIYKDGKRYTLNIKRLVASYFIRKVKSNERVINIDGDIRNNYYKNLYIKQIEGRNTNEVL